MTEYQSKTDSNLEKKTTPDVNDIINASLQFLVERGAVTQDALSHLTASQLEAYIIIYAENFIGRGNYKNGKYSIGATDQDLIRFSNFFPDPERKLQIESNQPSREQVITAAREALQLVKATNAYEAAPELSGLMLFGSRLNPYKIARNPVIENETVMQEGSDIDAFPIAENDSLGQKIDHTIKLQKQLNIALSNTHPEFKGISFSIFEAQSKNSFRSYLETGLLPFMAHLLHISREDVYFVGELPERKIYRDGNILIESGLTEHEVNELIQKLLGSEKAIQLREKKITEAKVKILSSIKTA